MDFKQTEQIRRLVEVTALEALSKIYMNKNVKVSERQKAMKECEEELRKYAFPELIEL